MLPQLSSKDTQYSLDIAILSLNCVASLYVKDVLVKL